jgi:hypothetical protein
MKNNRAIGKIICSLVVFAASFISWGSLKSALEWPFSLSVQGQDINPLDVLQFTATINIDGWNGSLTALGVTSPNYMVAIAALSILIITIMRTGFDIKSPPLVGLLLSLYGVIHCGLLTVILGTNGNIGIGVLISLGAFIDLVVISIKEFFHEKD